MTTRVEGLEVSSSPSRTKEEDRHQWFKLHNKLATFDICKANLSNKDRWKEQKMICERKFIFAAELPFSSN